MNNISRHLSRHARLRIIHLGIFLVYIVSIILIFFGCVYRNIEKSTEATIMNNIAHQSQNFQNIINQNFQYLEGVAQYIGSHGGPEDTRSFELLQMLSEKCGLTRMGISDPEGNCVFTSGEEHSIASEDYFQNAAEGRRALGESVEEKDGQIRVVLAVPIFRDEEVTGVVGGSCNLSVLGQLLLEDIYSGAGYILISDVQGNIISHGSDEISELIPLDNGLFGQLDVVDLPKDKSVEQISADFSAQKSDIAAFSHANNHYYIAYEPLGMENWMLCYIVPISVARYSYQFISTYGITLCVTLLAGMTVLLLTIFYFNSRTHKALIQIGQSDALTGVFNKHSTQEQIQRWLQYDGDHKTGLQALMMMDVDYFKQINDTYGHAVGDTILRDVGALLRHEFREGDIIGRIGGDEFCILIKNIGSEANAVSKIGRLCEHARSLRFRDSEHDLTEASITISVGLAFAPIHGNSFEELYRNADQALYQTKRNGRNGFSVYVPQPDEEAAAETAK